MATGRADIDHLLRRAGFGASLEESAFFRDLSFGAAVDHLVNYEQEPDDVDARIGNSDHLGFISSSPGTPFRPNLIIDDARQRWLFRMVHSWRPLQEKMALFWHNHFATAHAKLRQTVGSFEDTKMMARKSSELPGRQGQLELFRQYALGSFRDLLVAVAKDPAMLVWLDGRTNIRERPQENFGREIMELFTFGVGNYTEQDVYAAARVFTGWSLAHTFQADASGGYDFIYNASQHDTTDKTFTFAIYSDGGRTIPARSAGEGLQDGVDFITALVFHPNTARRLARKLWYFFVTELSSPNPEFVESVARVYLENDTQMRPVVDFILRSRWFLDPANRHARYAWPVEFVTRAIKEVGWRGFSASSALTPLTNMGQRLFDPPDVAGWNSGSAWLSTGTLLARKNFAVALAANQRFELARDAAPYASTPEGLLGYFLQRLSPAPLDREPYNALLDYLLAGGPWTGTGEQLNTKVAGLVRLIVGSSEYQLI